MKKSVRKRFVLYIIIAVLFAFTSISKVIIYPERENKGMQLFGIIIFGILAVFYIADAVFLYRKMRKNGF